MSQTDKENSGFGNDLKTQDVNISQIIPNRSNSQESIRDNQSGNGASFDNTNKTNNANNTATSSNEDKNSDTLKNANDHNSVDENSTGSDTSKGNLSMLGNVKGAVQESVGAVSNLNELYDDDTTLAEDVGSIAVNGAKAGTKTASAVAKAVASDVPGAINDAAQAVGNVAKMFRPILRIVIPLLCFFMFLPTLLLNASGMIWASIEEKYEDWAYTQAVKAIDMGINDAAYDTVNDISKKIEKFTGINNFKVKCNQYYENYLGDGYVKDFDDGTSLSIYFKPSSDGMHEDAHIVINDKKNNTYKITYRNADVTVSETLHNVSYSQIINAYSKYRENKAEAEGGAYKIYHTFNQDAQNKIKKIGEDLYNESISKQEYLSETEEILNADSKEFEKTSPLNFSPDDAENSSEEVWGLADTGALYFSLTHDKEISQALYDYSLTNGNGKAIEKSDVKHKMSETKNAVGEYELVIDVKTFDSNDKTTKDGEKYSGQVMEAFNITDEEDINEVIGKTMLSDVVLEAAKSTVPNDENFQEYLAFSQSKIIYEKIVGGKSVLEKMLDKGMYNDVTEETIRACIASTANTWVNRTSTGIAAGDNFFFATSDEFTNAFEGQSVGWEYDDKTGKYVQKEGEKFNKLDAYKLMGEDGMFVTYMYSRALYAGTLKDENGNSLKPRNYIFPEVYATEQGGNLYQLFSSEDYGAYFVNYALHGANCKNPKSNAAVYALTTKHSIYTTGWERAFNTKDLEETTKKPMCVEKGDLMFFHYGLQDNHYPNNVELKNNSYMVGIVTDVNYEDRIIKVAVYNADKDVLKSSIVEKVFDNATQKYGILKVDEFVIDYNNATVTPNWKYQEQNIEDSPNPLLFVSGYAKPDYEAYVKAINKALGAARAEAEKYLADTAVDLGGGSIGYPLSTEARKNVTQPFSFTHDGIDYGIPEGTPVYAVDDGYVEISMAITSGGSPGNGTTTPDGIPYTSYGEVIKIKSDGGKETYYAHLSKRLVSKNTRVKRGQLIGYSGNTGNSSGAHLHFELRINGVPTDPSPYMSNTITKVRGNYTYTLNKDITKSPINGKQINVTFYDAGACCNGDGAGVTSTGLKIKNNGSYYDKKQAYVACNWLPPKSKIVINFPTDPNLKELSGASLTYSVEDTGSADRLSTDCIDVFVPCDHSVITKMGRKNVSIKINVLGN